MTTDRALKQGPRGRRLGDPTISVIVTSYNYGHFLANCLDSVLGQTVPPDELIVVDDGSTDATARILDGYQDRIALIQQPNGGQAAAFNTGFAASRGELVLFLDADDMLTPEALETVLIHWADDLAVLTFGLETMDENGIGIGVHSASVQSDSGDNRPRLLRSGTFRFPPTSGNMFARDTLARALPMPEPRWRISADCYLIRAAALCGRAGHVPHVLGRYRLHRANNYARGFAMNGDLSLRRSNHIDVADALDDLARADAVLSADPTERAVLRQLLDLRAAALRAETGLAEWSAEAGSIALARIPRRIAAADITDHSAAREAMVAALTPRDPVLLDFETVYHTGAGGPLSDSLLIWHDGDTARCDLRAAVGPTPSTLLVRLGLRAKDDGDIDACVTVRVDGRTIAETAASDGNLTFSLPRDPWVQTRLLRISLQSVGDRPPEVTDITVSTDLDTGATPLLPLGRLVRAGPLLAGVIATEGAGGDWDLTPAGDLRLMAPDGVLSFAVPWGGPAILRLALADPLPAGRLRVEHGGNTLFAGQTGATVALHVPVDLSLDSHLELRVAFDPDEPGTALCIAGVGLVSASARPPLDPGPRAPWLNIGQTMRFADTPAAASCLADGWDCRSGEPARNFLPESDLCIRVSVQAEDLTVSLGLVPLMDPPDGQVHVVGISVGGRMLAVAELVGPGDVAVPLGAPPEDGILRLSLHSGFAAAPGDDEDPEEPVSPTTQPDAAQSALHMAPVLLETLHLSGRDSARHSIAADLPAVPPFREALDAAKSLMGGHDPERHTESLAQLRRKLAEEITASDPSLCILLAAIPANLSILVDLGAATAGHPIQPDEVGWKHFIGTDPDDASRLRAMLLAMLYVPADQAPSAGLISQIPAPLFASPVSLATYLGRAPTIADPKAHDRYVAFLNTLLSEIDTHLGRERPAHPLYRLARETLRHLRSSSVIFGDGALRGLIRTRSRCIERRLANAGAQLSIPRPTRPGLKKLRIGVLARDVLPNPEGWALLGMYTGLDPARFDPVLIRMDRSPGALPTGDRFRIELCLTGQSIAASVTAIRDLDLDVFVTGCYVADWEKTSAILAHRLAPLQIWHGAVCPTTGGFRSFDLALSCSATEPARPQRHYTETLAWIDGPLQCAYDFGPPPAMARDRLRRDLGVAEDTLLLVSGAMSHKITDPLLRCWAEILDALPDAVLVLYPFAPNWSMPHHVKEFETRLLTSGLPADRTILLPTLTPGRVRGVLSACDLYLDSFPYTGATTVCEALSMGTPALTCAGDALRQLTGASWVRAFGLDDLVVQTPADYVARAIALGRNDLPDARDRLARKLADGPPPHCDTVAFGRAYSDALWQSARDSGLFPDLGAEPAATPAPDPRPAPRVRRARTARLAILASPRTGSTLLCALLNRTPGITCHFELFHRDMIQYRARTITDPKAIAERDADPDGFLASIHAEAALAGDSLVAFKHFSHLSPEVTNAVIDDADMQIVHLTRPNLLGQYSSEIIAARRGEWASLTGTPQSFAKIDFDIADFERFEAYQKRVEEKRTDEMAKAGRDALAIKFSEVGEPVTALRLSKFLGLRLNADPTPIIQRQNRSVILDRFRDRTLVEDYMNGRGLSDWLWSG